jgi:hypothetical protein
MATNRIENVEINFETGTCLSNNTEKTVIIHYLQT